jgi:flagellar basal-body rod modification protein FlgD
LETAESSVIEIYDAADHIVWQQDRGSMKNGTYELDWDGKDLLGEVVPDGAYTYVVRGQDKAGRLVEVDYRSTGRVTGLDFDSGVALLTMDEYVSTGVDQVLKVNNRGPEAQSE